MEPVLQAVIERTVLLEPEASSNRDPGTAGIARGSQHAARESFKQPGDHGAPSCARPDSQSEAMP